MLEILKSHGCSLPVAKLCFFFSMSDSMQRPSCRGSRSAGRLRLSTSCHECHRRKQKVFPVSLASEWKLTYSSVTKNNPARTVHEDIHHHNVFIDGVSSPRIKFLRLLTPQKLVQRQRCKIHTSQNMLPILGKLATKCWDVKASVHGICTPRLLQPASSTMY